MRLLSKVYTRTWFLGERHSNISIYMLGGTLTQKINLAIWVHYTNNLLCVFKMTVIVQSLSTVWLFKTPWTVAYQVPLSSTVSQSLLKFMSTESVNALYHFIHCWPLHSSPSTFPRIRVYSNDSALHVRWPKYWSFSFSISPSNNIGLISFRIDWFDLHVVQGILKSLLQHHILEEAFLQCSAFLWSSSHICTWLLEKPYLWLYGPLLAKWYLRFLICCLHLS